MAATELNDARTRFRELGREMLALSNEIERLELVEARRWTRGAMRAHYDTQLAQIDG